jgi:hypothetical protein
MIHTDEDDEFARIERENSMKGQPYHWEADAIKAAVLIEREACARLCEDAPEPDGADLAERIRSRGNT